MRLTRKLEPPYEQILGTDYVYTSDTRLTKSFAQVEQKLGQYEDIDENPNHLTKIKKALETLKEILHIKIHIDEEENVAMLYVDVVKDFKTKEFTHLVLGYVQDKEKYDLLKEVLL